MALRRIEGTEESERIEGTENSEEIRADSGNDRVFGLGGDDRLRGEKGDDRLFGGAGDDRLKGGAGDDELSGGSGHDRFIFDLRGGDDVVKDFTHGTDRLDFTNFDFASADAVLEHARQDGANVIFELDGGETVTLNNVTLSSLDGGDFLI